MTTSQLLDIINAEANRVFTSRAYRNSKDERVLLVDMSYPDDVLPMVEFLTALRSERPEAAELTIEVITATPFGASPRRRIVVQGFSK